MSSLPSYSFITPQLTSITKYAQELLSTFATSLGEVSLIPSTGGVFTVSIIHAASPSSPSQSPTTTQLWDRKTNGGFPEVKHLKQLVRDVIDPARGLGHVDRDHRGEQRDRETADAAVEGARGTERKQDERRGGSTGAVGALGKSTGDDAVKATDLVAKGARKDGPEKAGKQKEDCQDCA